VQIRTIGGEDPEVAVLGALHDDEPCGASAIEECLTTDPSPEAPTAFIIANDRALERNERYIDVDLNRVLPDDLTSQEYERRLAADLVSATVGCETLGIHSTHSYSGVFGVLSDPNDRKRPSSTEWLLQTWPTRLALFKLAYFAPKRAHTANFRRCRAWHSENYYKTGRFTVLFSEKYVRRNFDRRAFHGGNAYPVHAIRRVAMALHQRKIQHLRYRASLLIPGETSSWLP